MKDLEQIDKDYNFRESCGEEDMLDYLQEAHDYATMMLKNLDKHIKSG